MFLGLIFFLELATGILVFVFKDWIRDQLNLFINNNVKAYRDDIDLQNLIDFAQEYVSPASSTGPPPAGGTCWTDEWEQVPCVAGTIPSPPRPGRPQAEIQELVLLSERKPALGDPLCVSMCLVLQGNRVGE